jgi:hypothetical protein
MCESAFRKGRKGYWALLPSSVIMKIKQTVGCVPGTQNTAVPSCKRWSYNTNTKNTAACAVPTVLAVLELVLLYANLHYIVLVDVTRTLLSFDD